MSKNQWGQGNVFLRGKTWWIAYYVDGKRYRESAKAESRAEAMRLLKKRMGESSRGESPAAKGVTVDSLLDAVLRDYKVNEKTHWWALGVIEKHLRPVFGAMRASRINTATVNAYVDARLKTGAANATVNHELALLRHALRMAWKASPPLIASVPFIPKLAENNTRKGFFTEEEYRLMLDALDPLIQPILKFGYWTGCRKGEILKLQWSQFDAAQRIVRLEPGETKNGCARTIPLTDELLETLTALKAERDENWPWSKWIFSRAGNRILDFRGAWQKACEATGVDRLFHDARRSAIRNMVRAGIDRDIAKAISGHKTDSVFSRYNIVRESDLTDAMRKVEEYGAGSESRTRTPSRARAPKTRASADSAIPAKKEPQKRHKTIGAQP